MPRLRSLIPNLCSGATRRIRDFDLRLGAAGYVHQRFIFQNFWKIIKGKDWSDPQPDSMILPKARGLLHMEREYFAHRIRSRFWGLSTSQPRSNQKYLEDYSKHSEALDEIFRALEALEDAFKSTRRLQDWATKSSRACQTPGSGTAHRRRMF